MGKVAAGIAMLFAAWVTAGPAAATEYFWDLPPGVARPRVPAEWPMSFERVELGRHLFHDTRLSGNGTQSCSSCHLQELAFTDGRARPTGSTGEQHPRSAMSLVNAAYRDALTWANPVHRQLEGQLLVPLLGQTPVELGIAGHESLVLARLKADPVYARLFAAAFPGQAEPFTLPNVTAALAAFVRSIVSFRSPFDRYRFLGDASAMSPAALRGRALFFGSKARCGGCHMADNVTTDLGLNLDGGSKTATSPDDEPPVFMFHNTGVYGAAEPSSFPADHVGLHEHTGEPQDIGKFRVPSLRNIAVTAPYMHDGSIATLDAVLDHYAAGGRARSLYTSRFIQSLLLSTEERADLIAFLESLTDREALSDPRWSDPWMQAAAQRTRMQTQQAIAAAIADPRRPAADLRQDAVRKPAALLDFMGVVPGMTVFDMNSADGYWAELLSRVVGKEGRVIAHNNPGAREMLGAATFERRYGGNRLPNVKQMIATHNEIDGPAGSIDVVLMSMVYHDTYWSDPGVNWGPVDQRALLASLHRMLKAGGAVVVLDHWAVPGTDPRLSAKAAHRIDRAVVLEDSTAAGFALDRESGLFANPEDDRTLSVFDARMQGKTDRFLMLFRRVTP